MLRAPARRWASPKTAKRLRLELQILLTSSFLYWVFCGSISHFAAQVAGPAIDACGVRQTALAKHLSEFLSVAHLSCGANSQAGVVPAPQ